MNKWVSAGIRVVLILMSVFTVFLAVVWIPDVAEYVKSTLSDEKLIDVINIGVYALSWLIIIISLVIYALAFKFPGTVEKDAVFTESTAVLIKRIAQLLLVDCALLLVGVIVLFVIGETMLSPLLLFFDIVGIAVLSMLFILSKYVKDAAQLKEEVDHTL